MGSDECSTYPDDLRAAVASLTLELQAAREEIERVKRQRDALYHHFEDLSAAWIAPTDCLWRTYAEYVRLMLDSRIEQDVELWEGLSKL